MSMGRGLARGVLLNWAALGTSMVVGFLLAPFVVHQLGNTTYGVWTLIVSIASYIGLLDLGLRGAVTRFVSKNHAQGNHLESSRTVSAALWLRGGIGLIIVAIGLIVSLFAPQAFRIPVEMQSAARIAIIITVTNVAASLIFGVFGGVLAALHRFDLMSSVTMMQTLLRAGGVIWLLKHGHGIISLAVWELTVVLLANSLLTKLCFIVYPGLRVICEFPRREILQAFWSYSSWVFIINVCQQFIYYTDNLVVGAFLSVSAVTFYTIGGTLAEYSRQMVTSLTVTFTPLASSFEAEGRSEHLRKLLIQGTRAALLIGLPALLALMFRGRTFIALWMGEQYARYIQPRLANPVTLPSFLYWERHSRGNRIRYREA